VNWPQESALKCIGNRHETGGKLTNAETIFHLAKSEVVQAVMKNLFSGKGANLAKKTNLGREPHLNIFYARYIGMLQIFCCKSA
jgi:hypothetical protein